MEQTRNARKVLINQKGDAAVVGKIILRHLKEIGCENVNWIYVVLIIPVASY
jgi:hypothetical protein